MNTPLHNRPSPASTPHSESTAPGGSTRAAAQPLTRRTLISGAVAGATGLALTIDDASAQRCPPAPERTKGPAVWLDLDQQDLDDSYDQSVYAYNQAHVSARRDASNRRAIAAIGKPERVAYGPKDIEKVDIYKTSKPNAPILMYLHGGAWRSGTSAQAAYIAEVFVKAGAMFVSVDFNNVGEVDGNLMTMVDQCRRAVAWTYRNAATYGGDPNKLYLSGFSSGAHLGGCVVITDWEKEELPRDILKGALLGSGMYEMKPARLSKRSSYVKFTDEIEEALSAQRHINKIHTPLVLTSGTLETPDFQRQSRDFTAAVKAAGKPIELIVATGYNHFEMGETQGNPYSIMGRAAMEMMKLG